MPNWCGNYIIIEGKSSDVVDCIKAMKGNRACYAETDMNTYSEEYRNEVVYTFNAHAPVPEEIKAKTYNEAGYNWQIQNWGVKWDCLDEASSTLDAIVEQQKLVDKGEIISVDIGFSTPWGPADEWLMAVASKHKDLGFTLHYEECGCECFGTYKLCCDDDGDLMICHDTYETEAEYVYAVDCNFDENETIDIMIERNDWHESKEDFIEAVTEQLKFISLSQEQIDKIEEAAVEMYSEDEEDIII